MQRYSVAIEAMVADHDGDLTAALVGRSVVVDGDGAAHEAGEFVRAMVKLESEERDRCAKFCALAVTAGLQERQVAAAERLGGMLATPASGWRPP